MNGKSHSAPLSVEALDQCDRCGAQVWTYTTHAGVPIQVDALPGLIVVDGRGKAYKSHDGDGYQEHDCLAGGSTCEIPEDDFLWP